MLFLSKIYKKGCNSCYDNRSETIFALEWGRNCRLRYYFHFLKCSERKIQFDIVCIYLSDLSLVFSSQVSEAILMGCLEWIVPPHQTADLPPLMTAKTNCVRNFMTKKIKKCVKIYVLGIRLFSKGYSCQINWRQQGIIQTITQRFCRQRSPHIDQANIVFI